MEREKEALIKELEKVKREYEEYKKRHPETTGVVNGKPYAVKENVNQQVSPKTPGAVKGHTPHIRPAPQKIDEIIYHSIHTCPHCNSRLREWKEVRERIVEDITLPSKVVTLHQIERRYCSHCEKIVEKEIEEALPGSRIRLTAMEHIVKLRIHYRLSIEKIAEMFNKEYGFNISPGQIQSICERFATELERSYEEIREVVKGAETVSPKDTG